MFTRKNVFFEETGGQIDKKDGGNRTDQQDCKPFAGEKFSNENIFWHDDQHQETNKY